MSKMDEEAKKANLLERYDEEISPLLPRGKRYEEKLRNYQYKSLKNPIQGLTKFVEFIEEYDIDPSDMRASDFQLWQSYLTNRCAESTAKNYFYSAIQYLRFVGLLDEEYENSEAFKEFNSIQTEKEKHAREQNIDLYYSRDQYEQMLDACELHRDTILIHILYHTGARATEIADLRVDDVDLVERSIRIRTAKRDDMHTRTIYYPNEVIEDMRIWKQESRNNYVHSGESDYLLLGRSKQRLDEQFIRNKVVDLATKAGFQKVLYTDSAGNKQHIYTPHEFRRGWIMRHLYEEMPSAAVKELSGHRNLETTEKYIQQLDDRLEEVQKQYRPE